MKTLFFLMLSLSFVNSSAFAQTTAPAKAISGIEIARHRIKVPKEITGKTLNDIVYESMVQFESEQHYQQKVILTEKHLSDTVAALKKVDATFGSSVEVAIAEVRAANPKLSIVIDTSAGSSQDAALQTAYLVPTGRLGERENLKELQNSSIELSKMREDLAVSYLLTEALARSSRPIAQEYALRFAEILLGNPAPSAEQISGLLPQFRKIPAAAAETTGN
jgi:hypothetical protein